MSVELRQLRCLVAIAEAGSFTDAAIDLGISQAAASRTLASLETALGVRLLRRTTEHANHHVPEENSSGHDLGSPLARSGATQAGSNVIDQTGDGRAEAGELNESGTQQQLREPVAHFGKI